VNIKEAVNIIKKHLRSPAEVQNKTEPVPNNQVEHAQELIEPTKEPEAQPTIPEFQEQENQQMEPSKQQSEPQIPTEKTEELLSSILVQLKKMQRTEMFGEFSIMRLLAGIVQIIVLFCLLVTAWFLMSPDRQDNLVFTSLGFAIIFQLMTLTFYIMQGKK